MNFFETVVSVLKYNLLLSFYTYNFLYSIRHLTFFQRKVACVQYSIIIYIYLCNYFHNIFIKN
jgi:hypothetical protein